MKHTPGPWSYDPDENEIHADTRQDAGGDPYHICEMLSKNPANARLIAASPDLLEALKQAVARIEFLNGADDSAMDRIRAAIAKAEGREK